MFTRLFKQLVDILNQIKEEAEKHRFELSRFRINPYLYLEFRCSRVVNNETIFYFEVIYKDGKIDFKMRDKHGNYM